MAKQPSSILENPWLAMISATLLITGGWLMKSFPVFIFFGLAPLFAIADKAKDKDNPYTHLELILIVLSLSFYTAVFFDNTQVIKSIVLGIVFTLPFVGYRFCYQHLGKRLGKFTIIFFWISIEYIFLKTSLRDDLIYLADALELKSSWWRWNNQTGYLTLTLWILLVNLINYLAIFKSKPINWYLFGAALFLIIIPLGYSEIFMTELGIEKDEMLALYNNTTAAHEQYNKHAELIGRTSTWIALLILLLALVKSKTSKK